MNFVAEVAGAFGEAHAVRRVQARELGRCEIKALLQMFGRLLLRSGKLKRRFHMPARQSQYHHNDDDEEEQGGARRSKDDDDDEYGDEIFLIDCWSEALVFV